VNVYLIRRPTVSNIDGLAHGVDGGNVMASHFQSGSDVRETEWWHRILAHRSNRDHMLPGVH
jgi:hypothetical protein